MVSFFMYKGELNEKNYEKFHVLNIKYKYEQIVTLIKTN